MFTKLSKINKLILIISLGLFLIYPNFFIIADSVNISVTVTICGNDILETGEDCDTSKLDGQSCTSQGFDSGTLTCATNCNFDTSQCIASSCGNNIQESGESCDGSDLAGETCVSQGFDSGTLTCDASCTSFNTTQCQTDGGGGGGGGGTYVPPAPVEASVTFSGRAYPLSEVLILKDAQIVVTTIADQDANFLTTLSNLAFGNYTFSLYTEDINGRRSSPFTFSIYVSSGAQISIGNIFISPSIDIDKSQVKQGDNIVIFGQTTPESEVTILVNSEVPHFASISSDDDGIYLHNFNTAVLERGDHITKSKTHLDGEVSNYSEVISFVVGDVNVFKEVDDDGPCAKSDVNKDGRVNLVDFSIFAYWYGKASPPAHVDLNDDNIINLVDFSIMAFCWTG